jgi:hypothetical protein
MTLTETMRQKAEADLQQAEADAQAARIALAEAETRLTEIRAVCDWLQNFSNPEDGESPPGLRFGRPIPDMPNTNRCLSALEQIGRPASNAEIREWLRRDGHDLEQWQVRGSMKHLAKKKPPVVESIRPGVWRLRAEQAATPFLPTAVPALNGAGGRS